MNRRCRTACSLEPAPLIQSYSFISIFHLKRTPLPLQRYKQAATIAETMILCLDLKGNRPQSI